MTINSGLFVSESFFVRFEKLTKQVKSSLDVIHRYERVYFPRNCLRVSIPLMNTTISALFRMLEDHYKSAHIVVPECFMSKVRKHLNANWSLIFWRSNRDRTFPTSVCSETIRSTSITLIPEKETFMLTEYGLVENQLLDFLNNHGRQTSHKITVKYFGELKGSATLWGTND